MRSKSKSASYPAKTGPKQAPVQLSASATYIGPLPHPDVLAKYEEFLPGSASIIIKRAEKQSDHRIDIEKKYVNSNINNEKLGMIFAFILAIIFGVIAGFCAYSGHDWPASIIGGTTVLGLVTTFITGRDRRSKELGQKRGE